MYNSHARYFHCLLNHSLPELTSDLKRLCLLAGGLANGHQREPCETNSPDLLKLRVSSQRDSSSGWFTSLSRRDELPAQDISTIALQSHVNRV